ncbi:MAG TPA: oligopeptide/dipeptide ABC transporter ATP-binding protein [Gemmataceae bacterium]|nr:oligopeptide/dipeptide ABC transporter ATP-binding protein [Gemmataceae bacterium]
MTALLEVRRLVKHFGAVRAVDDVSFTIGEGETFALVGESGCGKTTTGRCVLHLMKPTAGAIHFMGKDVSQLRGATLHHFKRHAQIVFQDPFSSLNPRFTIGRTIAEPLLIHRACPRSEIPNRVAELLDMVGLRPEYSRRHPHEFSGGQRQRVGIARALALNPRLIVADEPVSALDVSVQAQIINLMMDLQKRLGVAYLFISHNLPVVRHVAHRTAVMYLGKIVESGPAEELCRAPVHPYTQALLAAVPAAGPGAAAPAAPLAGEPPSATAPPPGCRFHPRCPHASEICARVQPPLARYPGGRAPACHHPRNLSEAELAAVRVAS